MRIAVDHDSTLADVIPPTIDLIHGYDDHDYTREDHVSWDWPKEEFGLRRFLCAIWHIWSICPETVDATEPGLSTTMQLLRQQGEVDIVTAHPDHGGWITEGKKEWLANRGIEYDNFVVVDPEGQPKAHLDYDVYIDDKPGMVDEVREDQRLYLYDQPYNRDLDYEPRVETLREAAKDIEAKNL